MKIKFLTIAFAIVAALAFVSCTETLKPTGDVDKDLKAFTEYIQKVDVKDASAINDATKVIDEFKKYYEANDELKAKWEEAIAKDPKAMETLSKFLDDAAKAALGEEAKTE